MAAALNESCTCIGYLTSQTVSVTIPTNAKTSGVVLRWRQLGHDGFNYDEWAIDHIRLSDVTIGFSTDVSLFSDNFDAASSVPYDSCTSYINYL